MVEPQLCLELLLEDSQKTRARLSVTLTSARKLCIQAESDPFASTIGLAETCRHIARQREQFRIKTKESSQHDERDRSGT